MITKVDTQDFFHIIQWCQTIHQNTFVELWLDKFFGFVIFIEDVSYNLFQNIFHRYQSGGLPVFIDNNCNMDFFRLHCLKERIYSAGFRDISDGTNQLWNLHQAFGFIFCPILMFHGIFDMDKSNNIIDIFMVYRITGITVFRHIYNGILQQGSIVQRIDIFPVSHNIFCRFIMEFHDILDHLRFALLNDTLFMGFIYKINDFIFCYIIFCVIRINTKQAYGEIG